MSDLHAGMRIVVTAVTETPEPLSGTPQRERDPLADWERDLLATPDNSYCRDYARQCHTRAPHGYAYVWCTAEKGHQGHHIGWFTRDARDGAAVFLQDSGVWPNDRKEKP